MAYMDLFNSANRAFAQKALDYYDGKSKQYLSAYLNTNRKNAVGKGMNARTRNLTKMIVDKSGLLFNGKAPTINVYKGEVIDDGSSVIVQTVLESADWVEFFTNMDVVLRQLKTVYVMVMVNPETKQFIFEILDQHNAAVSVDIYKRLQVLVYCTGKVGDKMSYRVWNQIEYFTILVDAAGNEEVQQGTTFPNPYKMVPASPFHDTNTPREGAWNDMPVDLIDLNDIYNLHISDSEFSAMWAKMPTLFTNAKIQGGLTNSMEHSMPDQQNPLGRWVPSQSPGFVGGPGTVVAVESYDQTTLLEYKAPEPNLEPLDLMVNRWVYDFAGDWSVVMAAEGTGNADSGFKLVVRELPNLELRKKRQRMMEAGFKRLYHVLVAVGSTVGITLPLEAEMFVKFGAPDLPIDETASEDTWSKKIFEKRASRSDYFQEVKGMSPEEAAAKIAEIDAEVPITPNPGGKFSDSV